MSKKQEDKTNAEYAKHQYRNVPAMCIDDEIYCLQIGLEIDDKVHMRWNQEKLDSIPTNKDM